MNDYILIAICIISSTIVTSIITFSINRKKSYTNIKKILKKAEDANSYQDLCNLATAIEENNSKNHIEYENALKYLYSIKKKNLNSIKVVRYDSTDEMGGNMSFSASILDEGKNGVIFTNLHTREGSYLYIRIVTNGISDVELADEEKSLLE